MRQAFRPRSWYRVLLPVLLVSAMPAVAGAKPMMFWNLTEATIVKLRLAPAGSEKWTGNQCENDDDKTVDADERLKLTGVSPGRYDVQVADKKGRSCTLHNVELTADNKYAFSISEEEMEKCGKQ